MTDDSLPRWAYVPGRDREPDRAPLDRVKSFVPARFETGVPADDPAACLGVALNDTGFYWESHEVLEAVWFAAPQGGRDRIALRGCIQIANANLKLVMARPRAAMRLLREALAEFDELATRGGGVDGFAGRPEWAVMRKILRAAIDAEASEVALPPVRLTMHENA